ncbi:hypothetical protein D3C73_930850 [compost metagenome]
MDGQVDTVHDGVLRTVTRKADLQIANIDQWRHACLLPSNASCQRLPRMLMAMTVSVIATPGHTPIHHATRR